MVNVLNIVRSEWFRWFDSGDVADVGMALNILEVCRQTPNKRHWIPSREFKVWTRALQIDRLPENAVLRMSAHMVDGPRPKAWPTTSTVHTGIKTLPGRICPAPEQEGKCGECRACWSGDVPNVSYHDPLILRGTRTAIRGPCFFMPGRPSFRQRRPAAPRPQIAAGLSIHTQAQGRRRTGQWSAIHGSPPLFHRQIKIHRRSRGHAPRKNSHRHNVYAPNAKQFARLIRIRDYSLLFLIRTKPAPHPCTDIRPASLAQRGFQSAGSGSFSVNSASMSSTGCAPSWASSIRFMLSNAWGYSCRMAASRATISSRESWSSW